MAKHYSRQFWIWGKIPSWTMQRPPMNSLETLCMVWPLRPFWVSLKPTSDGLNLGKGFQYDASPKTPVSVPVWSSCARPHGPETKLKDCICSCCGRNGGRKVRRIDIDGLLKMPFPWKVPIFFTTMRGLAKITDSICPKDSHCLCTFWLTTEYSSIAQSVERRTVNPH